MSRVIVEFRDGSKRTFENRNQRGTVQVEFTPGVVGVIDEYGARHYYPLDLVKEVHQDAPPGRW